MGNVGRIRVLFLALFLLLLPGIAGCAKGLTALEVVDKSTTAHPTVTSFKMDMDDTATMDVSGGKEPFQFNLTQRTVASLNLPSREMRMNISGDLEMPSIGKQEQTMDIYITGGWIYVHTAVPGMGEKWTKMKLLEEAWAQQDQLAQEMEILKSAVEVTSLGNEKVDGIDSYVIQVKPDMKALSEWVMKNQPQPGFDLSQLDLDKLFQSILIKEWIAKDSYLPARANIEVAMEMRPEDIGATTEDFEKLTMNMKKQAKYYDYNKPFVIDLPKEALNAEEVPATR